MPHRFEIAVLKTVDDARHIVEERGLEHVKVGLFDIDGIMRGKYMSREKFFSSLENGFAFCDVVLGWDSNDVLYESSDVKYTGWHTGYPDAPVKLLEVGHVFKFAYEDKIQVGSLGIKVGTVRHANGLRPGLYIVSDALVNFGQVGPRDRRFQGFDSDAKVVQIFPHVRVRKAAVLPLVDRIAGDVHGPVLPADPFYTFFDVFGKAQLALRMPDAKAAATRFEGPQAD